MTIAMHLITVQPDGYRISIEIEDHADTLEDAHDLEICIDNAYTDWLRNGRRKK